MRRILFALLFLTASAGYAAPTLETYRVHLRADHENGARLARAILDRYASNARTFESRNGNTFDVQLTTTEANELRNVKEVISIEAIPGSMATAATYDWTLGEYTFDGSGNITTIAKAGQITTLSGSSGGVTESYRYDAAGRLVNGSLNVAGGGTQTYTYDPYGNMTAKAGVAIGISANTNRLSTRVYDVQGNTLGGGELPDNEYTYDAMNMITHEQSANVTFVYTADDERIAIIQNPGSAQTVTWSVRDLNGKVLRDYVVAGGSSTSTDYVYRNGLLAASISGTTVRRYHLDHLGTPRLITDGEGLIKAFHQYYPYGEESARTGGAENARLRFTGHERDSFGLGLDYMHARYYGSNESRFLTLDPADAESANPSTWNRYAYVLGNPMMLSDPSGKCGEPAEFIGPTIQCAAMPKFGVEITVEAKQTDAEFLESTLNVEAQTGKSMSAFVGRTLYTSFVPQGTFSLSFNASAIVEGGGEIQTGIAVNTLLDTEHNVDGFLYIGGGTGLNVGVGVGAGWVPGEFSNFGGWSGNMNGSAGYFGATSSYNDKNEHLGTFVSLGPSVTTFGGSVTKGKTYCALLCK